MPDVCELPSRHRRTTPAPSPTSRLSNQTGALISFESPNADRDMIERRADHHRVDTATLDGSDGRRTRCEGRPCPAPGEPRIRRTTRRARTSAGPRSWWRAFARATPPVTSSRPGMKSLPLPEQRTTRSSSRIRPCEEFVRYPNAIGAARHFERPPRIVQDRTSAAAERRPAFGCRTATPASPQRSPRSTGCFREVVDRSRNANRAGPVLRSEPSANDVRRAQSCERRRSVAHPRCRNISRLVMWLTYNGASWAPGCHMLVIFSSCACPARGRGTGRATQPSAFASTVERIFARSGISSPPKG